MVISNPLFQPVEAFVFAVFVVAIFNVVLPPTIRVPLLVAVPAVFVRLLTAMLPITVEVPVPESDRVTLVELPMVV